MFKKREFADVADNTNEISDKKEGQEMAEGRNHKNTDALIKEWSRDAEQLKLIVSDFALDEAVRNKVFADALKNGATVFEAYKEMIGTPKPKEKRDEIFQNARSARRGTGGASINPAKLSSAEFKKYIDNIKNN